jgi:DNA topoisomerase-1
MHMSGSQEITQLAHSGVLIPAYEPHGFVLRYKGRRLSLTPEQEEMAMTWVKKLGTDYVKDPVFVRNFVEDFSKALGVDPSSKIDDFDFSEIQRWVEEEKAKKESMPREEKKKLAEIRKEIREANKEKYGYATLNGERVEIGNYTVEPPCIFLGRGKHPLRGRWKPRVSYGEIVLNLSPDASTPKAPDGGSWGGREFDPNALWVAKWRDKLTGKMKYVWIADSARFKQEREIIKFNEALELEQLVGKVRRHIERNLTSEDITRRKVATVAYLIDALKLRVGDEKDKDEADTAGAVTLRGSHIKIGDSGDVKFDFLGKDSVRWVKTAKLPPHVVDNLRSFIGKPREPVFSGVRSEMVNAFLGEVTPWLTAKVFRTYHASKVVRDYLAKSKVEPGDQDFKKKYVATMANLEAAITCNHKRKLPKNWVESLSKKEERLGALKAKLREVRKKPSKARAKRVESLLKRIEAAEIRVKIAKATRDYNLGTSLKSYIDPRIYAKWAKELGYDWKEIYPKTLQRKFAWVDDSSAYK